MVSIFMIFCPFIFFCLLNVWMVFLSKRAFGISMPVTMMLSTLMIYGSQFIFHTFDVGLYALIFIAVASLFLIVIRKDDNLFKNNYFSQGFFAFMAIYIVFVIIDFGRHYWFWDELSHWGEMVKEMMRIDGFYSDSSSELLVHKEYPPFAAIFEMLWCRLCGGYSEMSTTMSLNIFSFTLLITNLVDTLKLKKETWYKQFITGFVLVVIFLLTVLLFDVSCTSLTICADLFMSVMYVYIISLILNRDEIKTGFGYFAFLVGMVSLIIVKQMSIAFVLLAWFFFTIMEFFGESGFRKLQIRQIVKKGVASVFAIVMSFISYEIWGIYTKSIELSGQFFLGKISMRSLADILSGGGSDIQQSTFRNFVRALFMQAQSSGLIKMSYVLLMIVAVILLCLIYFRNKERFTRRNFWALTALFLLGSVGYAFSMLVLYMFCFSVDEMEILSGYDRYMGAYVVSEYLILLILVIGKSDKKILHSKKLIIVPFVMLIFIDITKLAYVIPQVFRGEPFYDYHIKAENIELHTEEASRIFLISSDNAKTMFYLNYYLSNRKMDSRYLFSDVAQQAADNAEYWEQVVTDLKDNDYLYVYDTTDFVSEQIGSFTESGVLRENTLYRVMDADHKLRLIEMN